MKKMEEMNEKKEEKKREEMKRKKMSKRGRKKSIRMDLVVERRRKRGKRRHQ